MDRFFVIINEANENAWSAYVWSDVKDKAIIRYDNNVLRSPLLKKLKTLKQSAAKAKTIVERSTVNKQMKEIIQQLEDLQ